MIFLEFIDLHGHYAWNIDDGIDSQENAKKVLKKQDYKESKK